eukprot:10411-Rhodomonas_salina.3
MELRTSETEQRAGGVVGSKHGPSGVDAVLKALRSGVSNPLSELSVDFGVTKAQVLPRHQHDENQDSPHPDGPIRVWNASSVIKIDRGNDSESTPSSMRDVKASGSATRRGRSDERAGWGGVMISRNQGDGSRREDGTGSLAGTRTREAGALNRDGEASQQPETSMQDHEDLDRNHHGVAVLRGEPRRQTLGELRRELCEVVEGVVEVEAIEAHNLSTTAQLWTDAFCVVSVGSQEQSSGQSRHNHAGCHGMCCRCTLLRFRSSRRAS